MMILHCHQHEKNTFCASNTSLNEFFGRSLNASYHDPLSYAIKMGFNEPLKGV
jgi:hypothetical protein